MVIKIRQLNNVIDKIRANKQEMNEQEKMNQELEHYEEIINDKIEVVRELLHEEDKAVVDQIIMKKNHAADPTYPKYDKKTCYYQEFWKVYLLNEIIISKIKDYSVTNKQIAQELLILEDAEKEWNQLWLQKSKKKMRRTSDMIEKTYRCPFPQCAKLYGSDVSLNLHMKLKHNSGTKTEREALAREICLAEEKGYKIQISLNFPPGYLQEFRKNFKVESAPAS